MWLIIQLFLYWIVFSPFFLKKSFIFIFFSCFSVLVFPLLLTHRLTPITVLFPLMFCKPKYFCHRRYSMGGKSVNRNHFNANFFCVCDKWIPSDKHGHQLQRIGPDHFCASLLSLLPPFPPEPRHQDLKPAAVSKHTLARVHTNKCLFPAEQTCKESVHAQWTQTFENCAAYYTTDVSFNFIRPKIRTVGEEKDLFFEFKPVKLAYWLQILTKVKQLHL